MNKILMKISNKCPEIEWRILQGVGIKEHFVLSSGERLN